MYVCLCLYVRLLYVWFINIVIDYLQVFIFGVYSLRNDIIAHDMKNYGVWNFVKKIKAKKS